MYFLFTVVWSKERLFTSALEYAIENTQDNQEKLQVNGYKQPPVCNDDVNLLGESKNNIKLNTEGLIEASEEVDLAVTAEQNCSCLVSWVENKDKI
jgi:hypothetical protein